MPNTEYSDISYLNIWVKNYQNVVWSDVFLNKSIIMINYGFAWRPVYIRQKVWFQRMSLISSGTEEMKVYPKCKISNQIHFKCWNTNYTISSN